MVSLDLSGLSEPIGLLYELDNGLRPVSNKLVDVG